MDRAARNRLVVENLPLVGYLVNEMKSRSPLLSREELGSAGALALVTAAENYREELGVPFGAYARRRILGAFADELRAADWTPRSTRRKITEASIAVETLTAELGRQPAAHEVAQVLGVEVSQVRSALDDAKRVVTALDDETRENLTCSALTPEEQLVEDEQRQLLGAAVAMLPEKLRYVIEELYLRERTVADLAKEFGMTHSAVSQQRTAAVRLLREGMAAIHGVDRTPAGVGGKRSHQYLSQLAEATRGGVTRTVSPSPLAFAAQSTI